MKTKIYSLGGVDEISRGSHCRKVDEIKGVQNKRGRKLKGAKIKGYKVSLKLHQIITCEVTDPRNLLVFGRKFVMAEALYHTYLIMCSGPIIKLTRRA